MLEVGVQMPAFTLRNTSREEVTDASYRGEITILAFFPMAFTGG
jgi:peroxiredoxin